VPRDRDGSFDPQIVKKRQRRLTRVAEIVLSLYAKGLTTGEIAAHLDELYEAVNANPEWVRRPISGWRSQVSTEDDVES
jgi:transposase-like protein